MRPRSTWHYLEAEAVARGQDREAMVEEAVRRHREALRRDGYKETEVR